MMRRFAPVLMLAIGLAVGWLLGGAVGQSTSIKRAEPEGRESFGTGSMKTTVPDQAIGPERDRGKLTLDLPNIAANPGGDRITGNVRTSDGQAVEGALMWAIVSSELDGATTRRNDEALQSLPLREWAQKAIAKELRRRASRATARTASDGNFEIESVQADRKYHVYGSHEQYDLSALHPPGDRWASPGDSVSFLAIPVSSLDVEVVGASSAVVELDAGRARPRRIRWSPSNRTLRLRAGSYRLRALAADGTRASAWTRVEAVPLATRRVTLELGARPAVMGRVLPPEGSETQFAYVYILDTANGQAVAERDVVKRGKRFAVTAATGFRYVIDDLKPGPYAVVAALSGSSLVGTVEHVVVEREAVWRDLTFPKDAAGEGIQVVVLGPDGERVEDAMLQATQTSDWRLPPGMKVGAVVRQGPGKFMVPRDLGLGKKISAIRLTARSATLGTRELEVKSDVGDQVELRYEPASMLELSLANYVGSSIEGRVCIELIPATTENLPSPGMERFHRVGPNGKVKFGPLQPGRYKFIACTMADINKRLVEHVIHVETLDVTRGTESLAVTLPRRFRLEVVVAGGTRGGKVTISYAGGKGPRAPSSAKYVAGGNSVAFTDIPAREYRVWYSADGGRPKRNTKMHIVKVAKDMTYHLRAEE